jgi:hypothetical protein
MLSPIEIRRPGNHLERVVDGHSVRISRPLDVLVRDVRTGLAHIVVSAHASAIEAHV